VALGASLLEVHITLSRKAFGPDVSASITPKELKELMEGTQFIQSALAHPIQKKNLTSEIKDLRTMFGKSLVAVHDLMAGDVLKKGDLSARKPGDGIPVAQIENIIGRKLIKEVHKGQFLKLTDLS
jgi:N-acetylneuraminate synthase